MRPSSPWGRYAPDDHVPEGDEGYSIAETVATGVLSALYTVCCVAGAILLIIGLIVMILGLAALPEWWVWGGMEEQ